MPRLRLVGKAKDVAANPDPQFQKDLQECYKLLKNG